jgi:hypothetical protein
VLSDDNSSNTSWKETRSALEHRYAIIIINGGKPGGLFLYHPA